MITEASCKSCGASIVWAVTEGGRRIPLDYEPIGRTVFRLVRTHEPSEPPMALTVDAAYVTHFVTCPNAEQHRRPR
jgi:hypothetical protein